MITITQTCERDGRQRELSNLEERQKGGWRVIEGFELCPQCIRDMKNWRIILAGGPSAASV